MKIDNKSAPKFVSPKNSLEVSENLFVEWQPRSKVPVLVDDLDVEGLNAKRVEIDDSIGWVRLYYQLTVEKRAAVAVRLLLQFKSKKDKIQIKPMFVKSDINTAFRTVIASAPRPVLNLSSNLSYELTGIFCFDAHESNSNIDLVVNLPANVELRVFASDFDVFACEQEWKDGSSGETFVIKDFELRTVENLQSQRFGSPIYGHSVNITKRVISGFVATKQNEIYASITNGGDRKRVTLNAPIAIGNSILSNVGFKFRIDDFGVQGSTLQFFSTASSPEPIFTRSLQSANLMNPIEKSNMPRERQANHILLWAPISICGLTVQLEQVVEILKNNKIDFKISYHIRPNIDHPLAKFWIEPSAVDKPKMVLYFERFYEFDRGFDAAFKVFYMNLDWLSGGSLSSARIHADLVVCPTPYLLDEMTRTFHNSQVIHLAWPPHMDTIRKNQSHQSTDKIKILYIGNDCDEKSRKHPFEVIEAIKRVERNDISFELKFRSPLPTDLKRDLESNPRVEKIIDWPTDRAIIEELYSRSDINLIPNACEGNGLSIIEAWAAGVVPAVLNGHPMIDVTTVENSYRINCTHIAQKEYAPLYSTTTDDIVNFLNGLSISDVKAKKITCEGLLDSLKLRQNKLQELLRACAKLSGIRNREDRVSLEEAHLPSKSFPKSEHRNGDRVKALLFSNHRQSIYCKKPSRVDVLLTTSNRAWCLRESLDQLLAAIRHSPFEHRLFVAVDKLDASTSAFIDSRRSEIDQLIWTNEQRGLPYMWNTLGNMAMNTMNRSEDRPDFICYIQDDCFIKHPKSYFDTMVAISYAAMPGFLGLVSGYYTEVHPGFADFDWKGTKVIASDTIDGKNFMGTPKLFASIGPLSWRFNDGTRRGNPGPVRGSHFDLWQWNESPNSLKKQNRINLILPELCDHIAAKSNESTWNNDTTDEAVAKRILSRKVYSTRE